MAGLSLSLLLAVFAFFAVRSVSDTSFLLLSGVSVSRTTRRTATPKHNLGFVDVVARIVGGGQAGGLADRARDVRDGVAISTHDVVVIVADAELVQAGPAGRLDAAYEAHVGEAAQHVVHSLRRAIAEALAHGADDRLGVGMRRAGGQCGEHRQAWGGDAQADAAQGRGWID